MNISEANDTLTVLRFLTGTSLTPDRAREHARDAALRLAERAEKPLLLTVNLDVDELDAALGWLQDVRDADAVDLSEWGDPQELAAAPCPVAGCGKTDCDQPTAIMRRRFVHVEDVAVAGGRL